MSSPTSEGPRGSSRGKRAAERPPSRFRRTRPEAPHRTPTGKSVAPSAAESTPGGPAPVQPPEPPSDGPPLRLLMLWLGVLVAGTAALGWAALNGMLQRDTALSQLGPVPEWLDAAGAVAVVTSLSWLLATRTSGRAVVSAGLALVLGTASVVIGGRVLPTGAAVLTCVVGSVYAVMATVPAVTWVKAVREVLIATVIASVTSLAAVGFEPTVATERFDIAALVLALALVFTIVYRLGAGLHGLGRRGVFVVAIGLAVLVGTLAYAELLQRYGAQSVVSSVLDFVDTTSDRIGAFPRPLVALLGIPALVWGTYVRARRRQGWWVCAFGVAATVPLATGLVAPDSSYLEAALRGTYSLVPGLLLGWLVIRADVALTGNRGSGGRRADGAEPHRPEPSRFAEL